ncbi:MAG: hypothetical protein GY679_01335 [Mycoplasma sp.]|nr:hypothetical protein [Mycoplasma sp.]
MFIVEDGTGLTDSNSYISVSDADSYFTDISYNSIWFTKDTQERERSLMNGTQFIDAQYSFIGIKSTQEQSLQWPRTDAIDRDGYEITDIPKALKQAVCEAAIRTFDGSLYTDKNIKGDIRVEKVDVIEVEYFEGTERTNPYIIIDQLLYSSGISTGNTGRRTDLKVLRV